MCYISDFVYVTYNYGCTHVQYLVYTCTKLYILGVHIYLNHVSLFSCKKRNTMGQNDIRCVHTKTTHVYIYDISCF